MKIPNKLYISDVAQSTANLSQFETRSSDLELKKDLTMKKKPTSKISRGLMDFISIGDAIGYAEKKTTK